MPYERPRNTAYERRILNDAHLAPIWADNPIIITRAIHQKGQWLRWRIIEEIESGNNRNMAETVRAILEHDSIPGLRLKAAQILRKWKDKGSEKLLLGTLKNPDESPFVRVECAHALHEMGEKGATKILEAETKKRTDFAEFAAIALSKITGKP